MQNQINTDHDIEGHEALAAHVSGGVESAVGRFSDQKDRAAAPSRQEPQTPEA